MVNLETLREQQEKLTTQVKKLSGDVSLAMTGATDKLKAESGEWVEKYAALGKQAVGEQAEGQSRGVLAARGLANNAKSLDAKEVVATVKAFYAELPEKTKALYENVIEAGRKERGDLADKSNEFALVGFGAVATLREKGKSIFNGLVDAASNKQG